MAYLKWQFIYFIKCKIAQLSTPLSGQFRSLASQKYNTFIYKHFSSIKNNHACMAHCLLEPLDDYKCEFFAYYNNW